MTLNDLDNSATVPTTPVDLLHKGLDTISGCMTPAQIESAGRYCDLLCKSCRCQIMARFLRRKFEFELSRQRWRLGGEIVGKIVGGWRC